MNQIKAWKLLSFWDKDRKKVLLMNCRRSNVPFDDNCIQQCIHWFPSELESGFLSSFWWITTLVYVACVQEDVHIPAPGTNTQELQELQERIRSTRIWGNFWMLNLLVHFRLALHLLHVCDWVRGEEWKEGVETPEKWAALRLNLWKCGVQRISHRSLFSIQHVLFCKQSQAVFQRHFAWALL